ncbi:uncharacterized protein METZ01_LOCUS217981, partial [marine metagenome]
MSDMEPPVALGKSAGDSLSARQVTQRFRT